MYDFDLLVIGSGPGGQKAAIAAAKLEWRVAIMDVIRSRLARSRVTPLNGTARFLDPHTIGIEDTMGDRQQKVTADKIVIATGTSPARPSTVEFDDATIIDSDAIFHMDHVPDTMVVVGAGVMGIVLSLLRACRNRAVGRIAGRPVNGFVGLEACTDVRL